MESKLSSDLFLGKMLWNVARNQNVGPDCDETLCRQRHKVSCTWQTKMTGIITPPVTSRKTLILPPSTAELLFLGRKRTLYVAFITRKDADCHFWQSKKTKSVFLLFCERGQFLSLYQRVGAESSAKTTAYCVIAIEHIAI